LEVIINNHYFLIKLFSVLISVYYKDDCLELKQSLDSVLKQTLLPGEIILVKDGSLTESLDLLIYEYSEIYSIIRILQLEENSGLGTAMSEGLKYCSYEFVARMDADDISRVDRFEKQYNFLLSNTNIDIVGSWISEFDKNILNIVSQRKVPEFHDQIYLFAKRRSPLNHPTVMFRKSSVLNAGGYLHFPLFEDYFLWVRMLMSGCRFYNIQDTLLFFRISPNMFHRRGGIKYIISEIKLHNEFRKIGFINIFMLVRNLLIRFLIRLSPNIVRIYFYKLFLR
jgi:glycosyltransferase involved in cell wall biosynthesis